MQLAALGVEAVHRAVPVADVDVGAPEQRRGLRGADRARPAHLARARDERDELAVSARGVTGRVVEEGRVDGREADRGRHRLAAVRVVVPELLSGRGVDRVDDPGVVGEEEPSVGDGGRELDEAVRAERPQAPEGRAQRDSGCDSEPLRIEAVHRPDDSRLGGLGLDRLGRDKLDGRRAPHVAALVPDPQRVGARHCERDERDERSADEEPAPQASPIGASVRASSAPPTSWRTIWEKKRVITTPARNSPRVGSSRSPAASASASSG